METQRLSATPPPPLHRLCVLDEGWDLSGSLTMWAGLGVCSPSNTPTPCQPDRHPLPVSLFGRARPTTPALRLQIPPRPPRLAACERVPACAGIPTGRENSSPHCSALIARQVPFLFCSLVFLPSFPPLIFSLCLFHGSPLCWQCPLCVLSRFPQWPLYFITALIPVDFHELY